MNTIFNSFGCPFILLVKLSTKYTRNSSDSHCAPRGPPTIPTESDKAPETLPRPPPRQFRRTVAAEFSAAQLRSNARLIQVSSISGCRKWQCQGPPVGMILCQFYPPPILATSWMAFFYLCRCSNWFIHRQSASVVCLSDPDYISSQPWAPACHVSSNTRPSVHSLHPCWNWITTSDTGN
jgi:hypothetical protein